MGSTVHRIVLVAIALGLWFNAAALVARSAQTNEPYNYSVVTQLQETNRHLRYIEDHVETIRTSVLKLEDRGK